MNRQQWKERLPLIEAFVNGETIQHMGPYSEEWRDVQMLSDLSFTCPVEMYRIKPKPREWWINVYPEGSCWTYDSGAEAKFYLCCAGETIHVREVVE